MNPFDKVVACVPAEANEMFATLAYFQPVAVTVHASTSADVNHAKQTVSENEFCGGNCKQKLSGKHLKCCACHRAKKKKLLNLLQKRKENEVKHWSVEIVTLNDGR